MRSIGASGQRDGISARSNVVLPLPRPPVSSKWRLPLARKERRIELAAGLYTGITVSLIPFHKIAGFIRQGAAPAAAPANAIIEGSWGVLDTAAARDEASLRAAAQELARQGAAYAVVTLKDSSGQILYPSALPAAAGSIEGASLDPSLIASVLKENGLVPVGKLAAFRDPAAARANRGMAIGYTGQEYLWLDNKASAGGNPWLNPYSDEAVQFIGDLIGEVQSMGFDHVLLENVQFPLAQNSKQDFGSTGGRDRSAQLAADIALWDARFSGSVTLWYGYSLAQVTDGAATVGGKADALGVKNLIVEVPAKQTMDEAARNALSDALAASGVEHTVFWDDAAGLFR